MNRVMTCARSAFSKIPNMSKPLLSFVDVAPESHFPLQNLPYGIFRPQDGKARAGVAIGDLVLDLAVTRRGRLFPCA